MDYVSQIRMRLDQIEDPVAIGYIELREVKIALFVQLGQARFFQRNIIVVVKIVDADYPLAAVEQRPRHVKPDKAGGTGNQNRHE